MSYYVAEFNADRERIGKIHCSQRPATAKRNRSTYVVACGRTLRSGLPVRLGFPAEDLCGHCWPLSARVGAS